MTTQKKRPAHEIRVGALKATIWANQSEKTGTWYCVTFQRSYRSGDAWKQTNGFGVHDLLEVGKLAERAAAWITLLKSKPVQLELPAENRPTA